MAAPNAADPSTATGARVTFPELPTAAECREAIAGRPEFRESSKIIDGTRLTVFNYDFCHRGTFPDPREPGLDAREVRKRQLLRECRGLLFGNDLARERGDPEGEEYIVARRFHKFFNVDQNAENARANINWDRGFTILEKLDGSLVSPILVAERPWHLLEEEPGARDATVSREVVDGRVVRWGSKQGPTDVTSFVEGERGFVWQQKHDHGVDYDGFARAMLSDGWTPLFEWCSLKNHIVLEYDVDQLGLTALRNNVSGEYADYARMEELAAPFKVPLTKLWKPSAEHEGLEGEALVAHFQETLKTVANIEGYVICFYDDNEMYKIKTEWYFARSSANQKLPSSEREVWKVVLDGEMDDILPFLSHRMRAVVEDFTERLFGAIEGFVKNIMDSVADLRQTIRSKKEFVAYIKHEDTKFPPMLQGIIFRLYDSEDMTAREVRDDVISIVKKHLTPKTFKVTKQMLPGVEYTPDAVDDVRYASLPQGDANDD